MTSLTASNMLLKCLAFFSIGLVMCLQSALAADAKLPPVADFFQNPSFSNAVLSPSGRMLAVVVGAKDSRDRLAVLDLDSMKVQAAASYSDADVFNAQWVNDRRMVFSLTERRLAAADQVFAPGLFAVNADGSGLRQLVQRASVFVQDGMGTRQLPWNTLLLRQRGTQQGDDVYAIHPKAYTEQGFDFFKLLRLNTLTTRFEEIDTPANAFDWLMDSTGELRAVLTARDGRAAIHWREADGKWRRLREFDRFTGGDLALRFMGADGKVYAVAGGPGVTTGDTAVVTTYDPATDQFAPRPVMATARFDVLPEFITTDDKLLGLRFTVDAEVTQWFDEGMKAHQAEIDKLLPATANMHFRAGFKQWGPAMQDDLADAARWAVAQGIADPQRICIMGASYGGYATLMGLAKDGDLFRCGVQWLGVADTLLLFDANWSDASDAFKRYGMPQLIGDRQRDLARLEANSPVKLAANIKKPLLMGYGRADKRVPIEHGRRMFDAVKPHNPNAEFVEYDKEGHGWALPATELDWWTRVETFLARNLTVK